MNDIAGSDFDGIPAVGFEAPVALATGYQSIRMADTIRGQAITCSPNIPKGHRQGFAP